MKLHHIFEKLLGNIRKTEKENIFPFNHTYAFLTRYVNIRSNSCTISNQLEELYTQFLVKDGAIPDTTFSLLINNTNPLFGRNHYIFKDEERVHGTNKIIELLPTLDWLITNYIISNLNEFYLIHAGAVSIMGKGVIFPASHESGKTTLVMGLVKRGVKYLSDEIAVIDPNTFQVLPFPKGLCVKEGSFKFINETNPKLNHENQYVKFSKGKIKYIQSNDIYLDSIGRATCVDYIIFPKYNRAKKPELTRISRTKAVSEIINNSFNFYLFKERGMDLLINLVENAECFNLSVNDLWETTDLVLDLVENR